MPKSNYQIKDLRHMSYATCIREDREDGTSIGNITKYSRTTSTHQARARISLCGIIMAHVPQGIYSLVEYYENARKAGTLKQVPLDPKRIDSPFVWVAQ